jgi:hypothetical protein
MSLFLIRGDEILFGAPPSQFASSMMNATDIGDLYNEGHIADARDMLDKPKREPAGIREPSGAINHGLGEKGESRCFDIG